MTSEWEELTQLYNGQNLPPHMKRIWEKYPDPPNTRPSPWTGMPVAIKGISSSKNVIWWAIAQDVPPRLMRYDESPEAEKTFLPVQYNLVSYFWSTDSAFAIPSESHCPTVPFGLIQWLWKNNLIGNWARNHEGDWIHHNNVTLKMLGSSIEHSKDRFATQKWFTRRLHLPLGVTPAMVLNPTVVCAATHKYQSYIATPYQLELPHVKGRINEAKNWFCK